MNHEVPWAPIMCSLLLLFFFGYSGNFNQEWVEKWHTQTQKHTTSNKSTSEPHAEFIVHWVRNNPFETNYLALETAAN